jgi:hypothetical protein
MSIDPKRIVEDDGASLLAAMLRAAHDDGLTQEEVDRIRAGLATTIVVGAGTIVAGAGTTAWGVKRTGMLASLSAKLGLALAIVGVGVAAGGAWLARRDVATVAAPPAARRGEATAPLPATTAHPRAPSPPSDPVQSASSLPEARVAAFPPAAKAAPHPWQPTPAAPATPTAPQAPIAQPASPRSATPADEGALLLEARRALDNDAARALELVREHERQFPNSQLAPERARIEAEAAKRSPR